MFQTKSNPMSSQSTQRQSLQKKISSSLFARPSKLQIEERKSDVNVKRPRSPQGNSEEESYGPFDKINTEMSQISDSESIYEYGTKSSPIKTGPSSKRFNYPTQILAGRKKSIIRNNKSNFLSANSGFMKRISST